MDLVDEKKRPLPRLVPRAGRVEHLLEIGDAGKNRRDLLEMQIGRLRQQPRNRGLAGAGRAPKDQRAQGSRLEQARKRAIRPEPMILAHHVTELRRPQFIGEWTRRVARRGKQRRALALDARRHPRSSTDSCWPARTMVMLQRRVCWPAMRSRSRVFAIFALLTETTRSPGWNPRLCAGDPLAMSTITTPCEEGSSRKRSASADERLDTLAPWNGDREAMTSSSCGASGAASSATLTASSLPARTTPSRA